MKHNKQEILEKVRIAYPKYQIIDIEIDQHNFVLVKTNPNLFNETDDFWVGNVNHINHFYEIKKEKLERENIT